jgi:acyl-CoA synthetase (AMP-forming)/AMP-acid ligase II
MARPELLGAYTLHPEGKVDPDTTGVAMADDIEIRIDNPDVHGVGEIVVRHPNMFLGYYKSRKPPPPTCATAGCNPATPAISIPTSSWW